MNIRPLHPDLQKIATEELNETPKRIESDVEILREWILKQPHITSRTDDQWLVTFLRGCKYSVEKAKEKVDFFYSIKNIVPEMTRNLDPNSPNNLLMLNSGFLLPLGNIDGPGSPIGLILRIGKMHLKQFSLLENVKLSFMTALIYMNFDDSLAISGIHCIIDLNGVGLDHLMNMTPMNCKKFISVGQNGTPARIKCLHYINSPIRVDSVVRVIQSCMSEKNAKKFEVYNKDNIENLYKHVPRKALPEEYGGENGTIQSKIDELREMLNKHKDFLIEEDKYITNEKLRSEAPKLIDQLFGVEGTFRKLIID